MLTLVLVSLPWDQMAKPSAEAQPGCKSYCCREGTKNLLVIYVQKAILATKEYANTSLKRAVGSTCNSTKRSEVQNTPELQS